MHMVLWSPILVGLSFFLIFLANKSKSKKLPPGPFPLPIIGNLLNLGQQPNQSLANLAKKYGPIMSLKLGRITTVVISSSSIAKEVLQKQDLVFSSRYAPDAAHALDHHQYSVSWLPVGTRWKSLRKIMTTVLFSGKGLDGNEHLRVRKVQELIAHCENSCKEGKAFDIGRAAFLTSLNLLSNTIFSKDLTDPNQDSVKVLKELVCDMSVYAGKPNLADFFPVLKKIDPQGIRRSTTVRLDKIVQLLGGLIKERLELRKVQNKSSSGNSDLLDICLDINEENPEEIDIAHIERLCVIKKNPDKVITEDDVFLRTHKRKQGTDEFVDAKSKNIFEDYTARKKGTGFDTTAWVDASGGVVKNRLYGFGSLVPVSDILISSNTGSSSFVRMNEDFTQTPQFEEEVCEKVEQLKTEIQSEYASKMEQMKVEFQLQLQEAIQSLRGSQHPPPTSI